MAHEIPEELIACQSPEAQAIIRLLLARIAELEARLGKTPRNSSLPPSSQHPHAKPPGKGRRSTKKRGGQPGHTKHERPLRPTDQCDEVQTHRPSECRGCGGVLTGADPQPLRHQVWEVPEVKPHVTEHQRHRLTCRRCGVTTCGALPAGVPLSQAGPRLVALTALLMGCYRQSKRRTAFFLEQVLGQPCSAGWVVKLQNQSTSALDTPYARLREALPSEPVVGMDETPTRETNRNSWLWTCVARDFSVFQVRPNRGGEAVVELLGEGFPGVVGCDRAKMYLQCKRPQWCWAHLKRDFQALIDSPDKIAERLGRDLMRPTEALFAWWGRLRDGTLTRRGFVQKMAPVRREVEALLLRGEYSKSPRVARMCGPMHQRRASLWAFVQTPGVEPTNNASERALRHAVIWRKLSFGTQSPAGSRFVERMLTLMETCRQQRRNPLAYLTDAIQAHRLGGKPPPMIGGV